MFVKAEDFWKKINPVEAKTGKISDFYAALGEFTPGAKWNGGSYIDANTGVRAKNHVLIYMDTYIMGQGYLPTTSVEVPEKYFNIKFTD